MTLSVFAGSCMLLTLIPAYIGGYGYYAYSNYLYLILVLPAFIISLLAQARVKSVYRSQSRVISRSGHTGRSAAEAVLRAYGITNVAVVPVSGRLTDHFDPRSNVIRLSEGVYNSNSIAAIGIACHEAGHAAQHAEGYVPIRIRNTIVPICNIGSYLGIPLAFAGYWLSFEPLIYIGLGLYSLIVIFQLCTLPVELDASRRAMNIITERGLLVSDEERSGAKKTLTAAAMTYVAALAVSLANLLRFILIFAGKGRRD